MDTGTLAESRWQEPGSSVYNVHVRSARVSPKWVKVAA